MGKYFKKFLRRIGFNKLDDRASYIAGFITDAILCFSFYFYSYQNLAKDDTIYAVLVLNAICFLRRIVKNIGRFLEITNLPKDGGKQHGKSPIVNIYSTTVAIHLLFFFNVIHEVLGISGITLLKDYMYTQAFWFLLYTGIDEFFDIIVKAYNADIV